MANETIYPFGAGALPAGIGVVNDLTTGGADKALSAQMGKELNIDLTAILATVEGEDLTTCGGSIRNSDNKWVQVEGYYGAIVQVDAFQGKKLKIFVNSQRGSSYAFVTAAPAWNSVAQFATGYSAVVYTVSDRIVTIPDDAVYLYVYMNSNGTIYTPAKIQIYEDDSMGGRVFSLAEQNTERGDFLRGLAPKTLRVATYNIGHFSGGEQKNSAITSSTYATKLAAYRAVIDTIGADVLGISEYSAIFGKNTDNEDAPTKAALLGDYRAYEGSQHNYSCDALFTKTVVEGPRSVDYECNQTAVITHTNLILATDYYYIDSDLYMHGERVKLVMTHLAFDNNNPQVCSDQIAELITKYAGFDKVIFMGDWNWTNASQMDAFTSAGYTLANDGTIITYPGTDKALDNIVVRGLTVSNPARVVTTSLSDHYPFYCDLQL